MSDRLRRALLAAALSLALILGATGLAPAARAETGTRAAAFLTPVTMNYSSGAGTRLVSRTSLGRREPVKGAVWATRGRAQGKWIRWSVTRPIEIDRLSITGAGESRRLVSGTVSFSDGSRMTVRTRTSGDLDLRFRARTVRWAVLKVGSARTTKAAVALRQWRLVPSEQDRRPTSSRPASERPPTAGAPTPSGTSFPTAPSSTAPLVGVPAAIAAPAPRLQPSPAQTPPGAQTPSAAVSAAPAPVVDAAPTVSAGGDSSALADARDALPQSTGASWTAPSSGPVELSLRWARPQAVASLQIYGSPTAAGATASGRVTFSDGTSLRVLPVPAGAAPAVTIAFPPRVVSDLTLHLEPRSTQPIRLREVAAFAPGELAPQAGAVSTPRTRTPAPAACSAPAVAATTKLRLICPATGGALTADGRVVVAGPEGSAISATAVLDSGAIGVVARAVVVGGAATLDFDARLLPGGPVVLRIAATGVAKPVYAQFVNVSRAAATSASSAAATGRTPVFDDEFDSDLSASGNGTGARYAATKPASWGGSEFGDAVFADPMTSPANLSATDGGYLRIRTTPLAPGEKDPTGWGRTNRGGILASASVAGGGFAAQYGYFEARMLAPAAPGTWPAFWMMSSRFLEDSQRAPNSEVDAVELYGQDPSYSCHAWHDWVGVASQQGGKVDCVHALRDWALSWHTYGVDVSPTATRYYIDGVLVSSAPAVRNADDPFYFLLDLSLGGGWPIDLSAVNGVTDLYVDYVRIYT